jgi:hypothetical protein
MSLEIIMITAYNSYKANLAQNIMFKLKKEKEIQELKREITLPIGQMEAPTCDDSVRMSGLMQCIWDQDVELLKKKWTDNLIEALYQEIEASNRRTLHKTQEITFKLQDKLLIHFKYHTEPNKGTQIARYMNQFLASKAIAHSVVKRIYAKQIEELNQINIANSVDLWFIPREERE